MTRLTDIALPAELRVGCIFAEDFRSNEDVALNGGTVTGDVTLNNGVTFADTGTNYIQYNISEWGATLSEFSFVCTASQDNDTNFKRLFTNDGTDLEFYSRDGSTACTFRINATAFTSDAGLLGVDEEVDIGVSYDGANIRFYRNGVQHGSDTAYSTAITLNTNNVFFMSSNSSSTSFNGGMIKDIKFFNKGLSSQEMLDYANNSTYNYRNKAVVDLPMAMANHKPYMPEGIELLTNGDFATGDTTGWTFYDYAGGTFTVSGTTASLTEPVGGSGYMAGYQAITTEVGKSYVVKVVGVNASTSTGCIQVSTAAPPASGRYNGDIYNGANGDLDQGDNYVQFTATATTTYVAVQFGGAATSQLDFTDCSVREGYIGTQDVSGKGNNANFGDGDPAGTMFPTKLPTKGYSFDGGDYLNCGDITALNSVTEFTIALNLSVTSTGNSSFLMKFKDGTNYIQGAHIGSSDAIWFVITAGNYVKTTLPDGKRTVLLVYDGSKTGNTERAKIYVDGEDVTNNGGGTVPATTPDLSGYELQIGRDTASFAGDVYGGMIFDKALTPLQAKDLHINFMESLNQI